MTYYHKHYNDVIQQSELNWLSKHRKPILLPNINKNNNNGLALLAGGIRSAVVNLGVIQGLENQQKSTPLNVMSSVSGGGDIASALTWFSSKIPNKLPIGSRPKEHNELGGAAPHFQFKSLAKLTASSRVDFGTKLTIDTRPSLPAENSSSSAANDISEIVYHCSAKVQFIYIKATFNALKCTITTIKKE